MSSSTSYQRLPQDPRDDDRPLRASVQAEFNRPAPAWWKRALLVLAVIALGYISIKLGTGDWGGKSKVIYATRYSPEHKYRPAASPVITETLPDGRIRIRGASIGGLGVRDEDVPETPGQKKAREEKIRKEARERAKAQLGLKSRKSKSKGSGRKVLGGQVQGEH